MFKRIKALTVKSRKAKTMGYLTLLSIISMVVAGAAMAITAPVTGDFAFNVYDIAVNDILMGPIGFVAGCFCVVAGVGLAIQQKFIPAVATCVCAAVLLGADALVVSMGMIF